MNIDTTKPEMYQTSEGDEVIAMFESRSNNILCVIKNSDDYVGSIMVNTAGSCVSDSLDKLSIILKPVKHPWSDLKKGDKCMVRSDDQNKWSKRYFSHMDEDGEAHCFRYGATEWSSESVATYWNFCRPPTEEELRG